MEAALCWLDAREFEIAKHSVILAESDLLQVWSQGDDQWKGASCLECRGSDVL